MAAREGALRACRLLIADDDPTSVLALRRSVEAWGYEDVVTTTDSSRVLDLVADTGPDLLLLDLHMPGVDGLEILRALRRHRDGGPILPVVVLTADDSRAAKEQALAAGAQDLLVKPFDPLEVRLRVRNLLEVRVLHCAVTRHAAELEQRVRERTRTLERTQLEVVQRLALAAEYRDDETQQHADRVSRLVGRIAAAAGLEEEEADVLARAAPLHDVGKIAVPDAILLKPGRLTDQELATMRTHTTAGARILAGSDAPLLAVAEEIALTHHERWDGGGYPAGLAGEAIPLSGRIVAIADAFDAMTSERPYKQAWPAARAIEEIRREAGRQFDPTLVEVFLGVVGEAD